MKLASIFFAAASAAVAVSAQNTPVPAGVGTVTAATDAPAPAATTAAPSSGTTTTTGGASTASGDRLATYKATPRTDEYFMEPVRVVHARVQSDSPILVEGQLVSSFGNGKLDAGYLSSLDTVNTASVEGALMYVQAEAINVDTRDASERCVRKTKVQQVIFYEILISQTNETIAQFQDNWSTPEYGPMIAMDGGRCTPTEGTDKLPVECYQFSGEKDQPNVGPFVGGTNKEDSDRAPYPGNYWFSFPNTCPTIGWGKSKTDECRAKTRKGLCPVGVAPNGVECTFAYNILGWVPIDDIVGITSMVDESTGAPYKNFTTWCKANESHIEFSYDLKSQKVKTSLPFWENPLNKSANAERTQKMLDAYEVVLSKGSTQVDPKVSAAFKPLPKPEDLAKVNPPCYKTVKSCGTAPGCKRVGYSQICTKCDAAEKCPTSDGKFKFPTLTKAFTTLSEAETKSNLTDSGKSSPSSGKNGTSSDKESAAAHVSVAFATVAASLILSLAL